MYIIYNNLEDLVDTEDEDDADEDDEEQGNLEEGEEEEKEEDDDEMNAHMQAAKGVKQSKNVSRNANSNKPKKQRTARGAKHSKRQ